MQYYTTRWKPTSCPFSQMVTVPPGIRVAKTSAKSSAVCTPEASAKENATPYVASGRVPFGSLLDCVAKETDPRSVKPPRNMLAKTLPSTTGWEDKISVLTILPIAGFRTEFFSLQIYSRSIKSCCRMSV